MKDKLTQFICFYFSVPIFVLLIMIFGTLLFSTIGDAAEENTSENLLSKLAETELFPIGTLDEIIIPSQDMYPIISRTISSNENILNETLYSVSEADILNHAPSYDYANNRPLVLVVHTHGTECYFEKESSTSIYYSNGENTLEGYYHRDKTKTRTEDISTNVVAVGETFCKSLEEEGVSNIHCTEMFDKDDYNSAYSNSGKAIEKYLKEYPSIKLVIDLHRDSLVSEELVKVKTVTSGLEERSAQVMIVAGSDAGGSLYPHQKNHGFLQR